MQPELVVSHYGPVAVFIGGLVGGPILVTLGGLLAHQHLMAPWVSLASAWAGSAVSNQALFLTGRIFRDRPLLTRTFDRPTARKALDLVRRHPVSYVFIYRFIMGLRSISPLVLGMTSAIGVGRFALFNLLAATLWAAAFTGLGYFSGTTMSLLLGRAESIDRDLLIGAALILVVALVMRWRKKASLRNARREEAV